MSDPSPRRAQIRANLDVVERRIVDACRAAGRDRSEVTLVAVTKTFPAEDVSLLAELGVRDIGENRDQEARTKHNALSGLGLTWHFVGRLQTNKCRSIAGYADVVHSADRDRVIVALAAAAHRAGRSVATFVQVSLDDVDGDRGGAAAEQVPALADRIAASEGLHLAGVMAVAPQRVDPAVAFARLAEVAADVRRRHPSATAVSAGMSGDLEAAVRAGATHLRIGTALLGGRPPLVR
jgi:pyridoxal phosphate enzyme (YggS family)